MALAKRPDSAHNPFKIQSSTEAGFDLEKGFNEVYKIDVSWNF